MTATALTYYAAREHIADLSREAERHRRATEAAAPHIIKRSIPRLFARRSARPATA